MVEIVLAVVRRLKEYLSRGKTYENPLAYYEEDSSVAQGAVSVRHAFLIGTYDLLRLLLHLFLASCYLSPYSRNLIEMLGMPPLQNLTEIKDILMVAEKGDCLTPYRPRLF